MVLSSSATIKHPLCHSLVPHNKTEHGCGTPLRGGTPCTLLSNVQACSPYTVVILYKPVKENLRPITAKLNWQPADAIYSADEVIATQRGCYEIPKLVL